MQEGGLRRREAIPDLLEDRSPLEGNWTQGFTHSKPVFYHWATPKPPHISFLSFFLFFLYISFLKSEVWNEKKRRGWVEKWKWNEGNVLKGCELFSKDVTDMSVGWQVIHCLAQNRYLVTICWLNASWPAHQCLLFSLLTDLEEAG
jgi:hypothetical protein